MILVSNMSAGNVGQLLSRGNNVGVYFFWIENVSGASGTHQVTEHLLSFLNATPGNI